MQYIGQEKNINIIRRWQQLPNFIIIQGDKNTGKTYLVEYMSNYFKKKYIKLNNNVESVRTLINNVGDGANAIYHFKDFDNASIQAKNTLLKITEETPKEVTIVITGSHQLPTLESRATQLIMSAYNIDDLRPLLEENFNTTEIDKCIIAGFDTPTKIQLYKSYEHIDELLNFAFESFQYIINLKMIDVISITNSFNTRYLDTIDSSLLYLTMLINIINYKSKNELQYKYSFHNILKILIKAKEDIINNNNLNRKFIIYSALYQIKNLGGNL